MSPVETRLHFFEQDRITWRLAFPKVQDTLLDIAD